jgi:hypothetical protein
MQKKDEVGVKDGKEASTPPVTPTYAILDLGGGASTQCWRLCSRPRICSSRRESTATVCSSLAAAMICISSRIFGYCLMHARTHHRSK